MVFDRFEVSLAEPKILYGGQAVIEGVMMRGRNFVSCAVRRENGEIVLKSETIPRGVYSGVWSKTPFLRALPLLWDTLVLGTRMLMWAANVQMADEMKKQETKQPTAQEQSEGQARATSPAQPDGAGGLPPETQRLRADGQGMDAERAARAAEGASQAHRSAPTVLERERAAGEERSPNGAGATTGEGEGMPPAAIYGTLALSLGLGLVVFFALPVLVANFLGTFGVTPFWNNIIEGLIRLGLFLAYLVAIGRVPEIQRVFMYHGAEHKTIAAYEGGAELVPSAVQTFSKEHPRCGTGFLLTVVVVSIIFFVLLGDLPLGVRLVSRIGLIPLVAAVSYELIRFASQHRNLFIFDWLIVRPSLALQSLTTRQPTDDMIEVAVAAFQDVRQKEIALAGG